jgi:hypothetical protein
VHILLWTKMPSAPLIERSKMPQVQSCSIAVPGTGHLVILEGHLWVLTALFMIHGCVSRCKGSHISEHIIQALAGSNHKTCNRQGVE